MRIAVFSDVHGNLTALEAVLNDIATRNVDQVIFAGDLCLVGPRPATCLRRIQETQAVCIYGNTDDWILTRQAPPPRLADLAQWTADQLSPSEQSWLNSLAFSQRISPSGQSRDDLLIVHANPLDVNQTIFPTQEEQMARFGQVRQNDDQLAALVAEVEAAVLAYGHLHIPGERNWKQLKLVNISSVSMPGDSDPRAKYSIFDWQGGRWSFKRYFVEFGMDEEIAAYRKTRPPGWEKFVSTIEKLGTFPQGA